MADADTAGNRSELADELLALAVTLARRAGDAAAEARGDRTVAAGSVGTKSSATDLVTVHDRAAETVIVDGLLAARPDDAIVGEEGSDRPGRSGITWYVDPIDGTTNFVYGQPTWATSIAAVDDAGTLVGAVYLPVAGELFSAIRGRGATLDGETIRCSAQTDLRLALLATGFSYDAARRREQANVVADLIGSVRDLRRLGSAAADLCFVACGRVDAYYEDGLRVWDVAAGELIAREAGCRTGDLAGGPSSDDQVVAAAPALFEELVDVLSAARAVRSGIMGIDGHPDPGR